VSLVEVSPSMDMQFNESSQASWRKIVIRGTCSHIGEQVDQHGRELGMDHAAPLAIPSRVTLCTPSSMLADAIF